MPASVLLAVSTALMLPGLRDLLSALGPATTIHESTHPATVLESLDQLHPEVLLLELDHLGQDPSEVLRQICARHPATHVIVLTVDKSRESVHAAIAAGASGYLFLGDDLQNLAQVILTVHAGNLQVSPSVLQFLLSPQPGRPEGEDGRAPLTPREQEVARLVASGHLSKDIAALLQISPRTVDSHRANIRKKLHAHSTAEVVRYGLSKLTTA